MNKPTDTEILNWLLSRKPDGNAYFNKPYPAYVMEPIHASEDNAFIKWSTVWTRERIIMLMEETSH